MPEDPWGDPCRCGHEMRRHRLDWDVETDDPDCDQCDCPDFEPLD